MSRERSEMITVSTLTFIKVLIIGGALWFLYYIWEVVALLFISLVFASALSPWVASMERRKIPRIAGILLIYLSLIALLILVIVLLIPPLSNEYTALVAAFPEYTDGILRFVHSYSPELNILDQLKKALSLVQSSIPELAGHVFSKIFDVLRGFLGLFLVFVVTFYMIVEEEMIKKTLRLMTPVKYHSYVDEMVFRVQHKVGLWLRGQMTLCVIIFAITYVGLSLLGVKYALTLALVAGLTEFFPVIGPTIGAIPSLFIAFGQSPLLAAWVLLLYIVVQRLENDLLVPRVMQLAVGINPLVSIIALLIGGKIGGLVGILLAIPVATMIMTIFSDFTGTSHDDYPSSRQKSSDGHEGGVLPPAS